jgi:diaminohydroxyphosphoribosylaminopyrimidine deaminase/5-amino-6-(5-phosphoribosylamino)uracil reductase
VSHFERALELAERGRLTASPNPVVGAVLARDGEVVGEGWHVRRGEAHAEANALAAAGPAARGATLYVTLEPCTHFGLTPPCADAVIAAGVARVVVGQIDPNPEVSGAGVERLRAAGIEVEVLDDARARRQLEAYRTWRLLGRPFVTYKAAVTLDGRMTVPGSRWVTGEESRRVVHELRARADAVAVGMGTFRADAPRLDARGIEVERQPRRLVFGSGPLPAESGLELVPGPLDDELRRLGGEGVQSLLLEGGPTLAAAFLRAALVDKLLVFVAPRLSGSGPTLVESLAEPLDLSSFDASPVGEDVLLSAYVHEP